MAITLRRKSRGNPFGINKPWQCAFIPMGGPQAHGKLIVAPGELLRSSAKCRIKIISAELGKQVQVLSGGPPAQSAQKLIAVCSNSSLRPRHHSGFAELRTIPSTHSSGTGMLWLEWPYLSSPLWDPSRNSAGAPPDTSFLAAIQCACYPAPSQTPCARDTSCTQPFPSYSSPKEAANPARPNYIPREGSHSPRRHYAPAQLLLTGR